MGTLIVIAAHGPNWIGQLRESLTGHTGNADILTIDTGDGDVPDADVVLHGGHPTGAYQWAYQHHPAYTRYLFLQDSMTALEPVLPWFEDQFPDSGHGAVAWGRFPMQFDDQMQHDRVRAQYPGISTDWGIFGPVFYTDRASLDALSAARLMPGPAWTKWEAQASERCWAYAYAAAGLPVVGPEWSPGEMCVRWGPFRKVWAGRT